MIRHALIATSGAALLTILAGSAGAQTSASIDDSVFPTAIESKAEAVNFLRLAGLGPTQGSVNALNGSSATNWVRDQIAKPPRRYRDTLRTRGLGDTIQTPNMSQLTFETMITTDAEARTRMAFALSQIFVINDRDLFAEGLGIATYVDILDRNAFGNFRDILGQVTRSPVMGKYLSSLYNQKGLERTGRQPDENFAREILQLFSIGLVELQANGQPRLDAGGNEIETYTNDDITGLAKVFTGYTLAGTSPSFRDRFPDTWERPMSMNEPDHSPLEKVFLDTTIPAGTSGEESVEIALDAIFANRNVGPFISRQLIQRFTASDPRPAYVARVTRAFNTGSFTADDGTQFGTNRRGCLTAVYAAIVLDPDVHDERARQRDQKAREPVLNFVQAARMFRPANVDLVTSDSTRFNDTSDIEDGLAQSPLKSPSVFNFYRPGYVAPGTKTGALGRTAPELQIVNAGTASGYLNYMFLWASRRPTDATEELIPDFTRELAMADRPGALIERLDLVLTGGTLSPDNRRAIRGMIDAVPIRDSRSDLEETDRRTRVSLAVTMIVATPEYMTLN